MTELLRAPLVYTGPLINRNFIVAPEFAGTPTLAAIDVSNTTGAVLENVTLDSGLHLWQPRWSAPEIPGTPGVQSGMSGIRCQNSPGLQMRGVTVRGFPGIGIDGHGLTGAVFEELDLSECWSGLKVSQYLPNERLRVDGVNVRNTWGPGPSANYLPSQLRPGQWIGADGMIFHNLRDSSIKNVTGRGEMERSIKLVNPIGVTVSNLDAGTFQIQGTTYQHGNYPDQPPNSPEPHSRGCILRDSHLDKSVEYGKASLGGHCVQMTYAIDDFLFERVVLRSGGRGGSGVQQYDRVEALYRDCDISGFNATNAFGIEALNNSSFKLAGTNRFEGQIRISRTA